ncbi:hypothetical protein ABIB62_002269 [Mucilaginibacter sp. UYP25]
MYSPQENCSVYEIAITIQGSQEPYLSLEAAGLSNMTAMNGRLPTALILISIILLSGLL